MCPITVRKALENVNGVNDVEVSYAGKQAVIQYDDKKANIKALIEATTQAGYPSLLVER
jgi:mercuric ion binding protein